MLLGLPSSSAADGADLQPGDIVVSGKKGLYRVDATTGETERITSGRSLEPFPYGTAITSGGDLVTLDLAVYEWPSREVVDRGGVVVVDPKDGRRKRVSDKPPNPAPRIQVGRVSRGLGIAIDEGGKLLIPIVGGSALQNPVTGGIETSPQSAIVEVNLATGKTRTVATGDPLFSFDGGTLMKPRGLALDASGDIIAAGSFDGFFGTGSGLISRVDRASGEQSPLCEGLHGEPLPFEHLTDVAVAPGGSVYFVDFQLGGDDNRGHGRVLRLDPEECEVSLVSGGGALRAPVGIEVESAGGLIVVDQGSIDLPDRDVRPALLRVVPAHFDPENPSGNQVVLTRSRRLRTPTGVAIVPGGIRQNRLVFAGEEAFDAKEYVAEGEAPGWTIFLEGDTWRETREGVLSGPVIRKRGERFHLGLDAAARETLSRKWSERATRVTGELTEIAIATGEKKSRMRLRLKDQRAVLKLDLALEGSRGGRPISGTYRLRAQAAAD